MVGANGNGREFEEAPYRWSQRWNIEPRWRPRCSWAAGPFSACSSDGTLTTTIYHAAFG
jgi:hypothetical protein